MKFEADIRELSATDVLVCGGGPSGISAALAAAREGLSVRLVESRGQLGGTGVSGLVTHWLGGRTHGGEMWVIGGLFRSLAEEATALGIARLPVDKDYPDKYQPFGWARGLINGVPFEPFEMAAFLDKKLADAGVEVIFDTQAVKPVLDGNKITHVILSGKSGLLAAPAKLVIDATGDADIAARSGCAVQCGREGDGLTAPSSLEFLMEGVDEEALSRYIHINDTPRFRPEIIRLREAGIWKFPYEILISVEMDQPGTMMINTTRLCGIDGTDTMSVSEGLRRGRAEVLELAKILKEHIPGFEHSRIKTVAPMLGIRETRRIVGREIMTVQDVLSLREYPDTIGYSAYGWDLPDPKKPSLQPMTVQKIRIPKWIPIPYRVMLPDPVCNLICPGRAIGVERDVLGPLREMAPCMAMGEAAGVAAGMALAGGSFREVDAEALRARLRSHGAILDVPESERGFRP